MTNSRLIAARTCADCGVVASQAGALKWEAGYDLSATQPVSRRVCIDRRYCAYRRGWCDTHGALCGNGLGGHDRSR